MRPPNWGFADQVARQTGKTTAICAAAKAIGATVVTGNALDLCGKEE